MMNPSVDGPQHLDDGGLSVPERFLRRDGVSTTAPSHGCRRTSPDNGGRRLGKTVGRPARFSLAGGFTTAYFQSPLRVSGKGKLSYNKSALCSSTSMSQKTFVRSSWFWEHWNVMPSSALRSNDSGNPISLHPRPSAAVLPAFQAAGFAEKPCSSASESFAPGDAHHSSIVELLPP
jgi:hypothetical protein